MQNGILKYASIVFVLILTSCFYFPFSTVGMSGANSKMLLAAVGLCIYVFQITRKRVGGFEKDTFTLSLIAAAVTVVAIAAAVYNNTSDYAYASYIASMWVWIGAAYVVVNAIRRVHGSASIRLIGNYLIGICVLQCVLALMIDGIPEIKRWVDTYFLMNQEFLNNVDRLYGIGASLDVGGSRFSAVLIVISIILVDLNETESKKLMPLYLIAFIWISIVGNMIARTTTVGVILGLIYLACKTRIYSLRKQQTAYIRLWKWCGGLLVAAILAVSYFYQTDPKFRHDFRFAFEGFFSLAEEGKWEVGSNETLKNMYVFPETAKTWIIGDGYFDNPILTDPYFTGKVTGGFYMGTDVGYLRFIFYFGLIGLITFSSLFCKATQICRKRFPDQKDLFALLLLAHFIIWLKVSTDLFPAFAIFLMIDKGENDIYKKIHIADAATS